MWHTTQVRFDCILTTYTFESMQLFGVYYAVLCQLHMQDRIIIFEYLGQLSRYSVATGQMTCKDLCW